MVKPEREFLSDGFNEKCKTLVEMGSTNGDRITKEQRHKAGTCLLSPQSQRTRRQRTEGPGFDPWVGTIPWRRKWPLVGSQREELLPWQRSWGRKLGICKGVIKPQETACSRASTPQTRVLYRELSPITISLREGVNLQLQLIKIPGRDKSVSTYELWRFSGLPDQARLATCECLQPPNCERHGMF